MRSNPVTAVATALCTGAYLWFGGRISVALAILVSYGIWHEESHKVVEEKPQLPLDGAEEKTKKKHTCCGGKGGSGCCSSKNGDGGSAHACRCGSKKNKAVEEQKKDTDSYPVAVDFTQAFKPEKKKKSRQPKVFSKSMPAKKQNEAPKQDNLVKSAMTVSNETLLNSQIYIFYCTLQGAAERCANKVMAKLCTMKELKHRPILLNLDDLSDIDDYFVNVPCDNALYLMVLPSYDTDCPLDFFLQTLEENFHDFRVDRFPLKKLVGYSILGIGDSESWPERFCYQAKKADHWIARLGGRRVFPVGEVCMKYDGEKKIEDWTNLFAETLKDDEPMLYEYDESVEEENENADGGEEMVDLEDIGNADGNNSTEIKQMVAKNSPTYKTLTKQGYSIVGSHSGVKICRWTKSDLRGRGSCYKHSLFNIVSSRCMELTPSLACSSKCVFCWRHGSNPVSKNWRWEVDDPEYILENALTSHYSKIKQMRGVPGVKAERFAKAFQVRHCALSLVGEPIMYPYISKFISLLHAKGISSFLVCNAQHPEALAKICKVTQLYVSIDASTKSELKKIDRPLYKDFWERLMQCLDILSTTQSHQRTVFRLTLVKGFNMAEVMSYADLVQRGKPCFIEIKGATFAGSSDGNGNPLTMQNIPFYEEIKAFVRNFAAELQRRGLGYDISAEHAHSNCILIANTKFKIDGEWYTHIDFDRYFELLNSGKDFQPLDYIAKTPEWALFGNGGFVPGDTRFYRKGKKKGPEQAEPTPKQTVETAGSIEIA
ncbi:hypothetical protein ZYGR_0I05640 [Zygosaccharomyces rouxii]|uniref:S-adenosyl-L-methionine-dependent tRNA 4-demethylwyosine synthase n=2 Tax=Zygosaccharomyces rouxii TaxID=4956 RepID=C5DU29_ZYGRC|nr:uncharacterized protein ZYRO0C13398g [Zygosaccharomyces rouxii]KAH9201534.1 hypothetical protein LQ764DRAFT_208286 [Zygosaccharomyces rouxii]GAV48267.1 hypothetical protein ZYGR_0I05640 [Zygosaccharomyces rouxii]CAR27290.1 ZYRO0C13398p [Zygosaccharomyces rouxii]